MFYIIIRNRSVITIDYLCKIIDKKTGKMKLTGFGYGPFNTLAEAKSKWPDAMREVDDDDYGVFELTYNGFWYRFDHINEKMVPIDWSGHMDDHLHDEFVEWRNQIRKEDTT